MTAGELAASAASPPRPAPKRPASDRFRGGWWRPWYAEWDELPAYQALPASVRDVLRWLWTRTGGEHWFATAASAASAALGIVPRTWRRAVRRLVEEGLLDVQWGGGCHNNPNRYRARALSWVHNPGRPVARVEPAPAAPGATEPTSMSMSVSEVPTAELLAPAEGSAPAVELTFEGLPDDWRTALVTELACEGLVPEADARASAAGLPRKHLAALLRSLGFEPPGEGQVQPVRAAAVRPLAHRIVADYLTRIRVARRPSRQELSQAEALVTHSGVQSWERYEAAYGLQVQKIAGWKGKFKPETFGSLWMHLVALHAVPHEPVAPSELPPPVPEG